MLMLCDDLTVRLMETGVPWPACAAWHGSEDFRISSLGDSMGFHLLCFGPSWPSVYQLWTLPSFINADNGTAYRTTGLALTALGDLYQSTLVRVGYQVNMP